MAYTKPSLALNDQGEHVTALHNSLLTLGYKLPEYELEKDLFAVGTRDILLRFQKKYKLRRTGRRGQTRLKFKPAKQDVGNSKVGYITCTMGTDPAMNNAWKT